MTKRGFSRKLGRTYVSLTRRKLPCTVSLTAAEAEFMFHVGGDNFTKGARAAIRYVMKHRDDPELTEIRAAVTGLPVELIRSLDYESIADKPMYVTTGALGDALPARETPTAPRKSFDEEEEERYLREGTPMPIPPADPAIPKTWDEEEEERYLHEDAPTPIIKSDFD